MTKEPKRGGEPWPLTLDQCAERLHISRRTLQKLLKEYPYYRKAGRRILLTREDFKRLLDALPSGESVYRPVARHHYGRGYDPEPTLDEVLKRLEGPQRKRAPKKSKVVAFRGAKPV